MKRYDLYYNDTLEKKGGMYILYSDYQKEIAKLQELSKAYEDYISLLGDELNGFTPLAHTFDWRSQKIEQGKIIREKIEALKQELEGNHD